MVDRVVSINDLTSLAHLKPPRARKSDCKLKKRSNLLNQSKKD